MAVTNVRFLTKVGNTEAGTVREVDEDSPLFRIGAVEKVSASTKVTGVAEDSEANAGRVEEMSVPELRAEARRRGLDDKGRKPDLLLRLQPDPRGEHDNIGGEEPGEGIPPEVAANPDLTDLDGHDEIITEDHFAGESNTDDPGVKIATTEDFAGESDPQQDVPDPTPSAPADEDDDF